eukprot:18706-Chlamydomonas_euryale.AAC.5
MQEVVRIGTLAGLTKWHADRKQSSRLTPTPLLLSPLIYLFPFPASPPPPIHRHTSFSPFTANTLPPPKDQNCCGRQN